MGRTAGATTGSSAGKEDRRWQATHEEPDGPLLCRGRYGGPWRRCSPSNSPPLQSCSG